MTIWKKNFDDISKIDRVIAIFQPSQFFLEILRFSFSKLDMAIAQSFLKIQSSSFLQTSPFFMWKRILHQNWGVIGSHVWSFLVSDRLRRAKIGVPPQKISNFFPEIFCQRIDRKSQEVSTTYVKPLGFDRRWKKVWVNLTPPPCVIGLIPPG